MARFLIRRLVDFLPTILIVTVGTFLFIHLLPGDPARLIAGQDATSDVVAMVRHELGLDKSLFSQFLAFIVRMLQGDFGTSMVSNRPVIMEISNRFMPTFWLTLISMTWAVIFGMAMGLVSAIWKNSWLDKCVTAFAISGLSIPSFALSILLLEVFSVGLGWLPTVGNASWKHYILPTFTLGLGVAAVVIRFTRSSFLTTTQADYMRTARAKGVPERRVVLVHGLRNALIPIMTTIGVQFGLLLGGSIVVESVFNWPGLGRLLLDSAQMRDYPVLQAEILLFSIEFILINLVVDIIYAWVNPVIRYGNNG